MSLVIYNSLTRTKAPFEPVSPGKVGMYLCGPTVYKPSHIGHAVGPITFDAIKRYLTFRGFKVTWVVNVTDVDDKLIIEAKKQGVTTMELAERVTGDYLKAMAALHVDGIDIMPKASEHIGEIVAIIEQLIQKGCAYVSGGDVYFDVTTDADYGKLSNRSVEEQSGQRDLQSGEKRNPGDFALWKAAKPEEPDEVKYDSPWGKGRPGWHIECSAMAKKHLGETFDIHGGGLDLIFPHHENEIAQSESANDKPFAKVWMHHGLTRVNTKKISKSDSSPEMQAALAKMTLHTLLAEYPPELVRYFILSTHYRRPIEYSEAEFDSKRKGLDTFYRLFERVERTSGQSAYALPSSAKDPVAFARAEVRTPSLLATCEEHIEKFTQSMDDDFNTAGAIAAMFDFAGAVNRLIEHEKLESPSASADLKKDALGAGRCLVAVGRLIGLFLESPAKKSGGEDGAADKAMRVLLQVRQHLRKKKDFETSDMIRDLLAKERITIEDRADGSHWRAE